MDQNANELWSVLVCKPWLDGEFGTTQYAAPGTNQPQTVVNQYGRQLLWAQAVAANEQPSPPRSSTRSRRRTTASRMQLQQTNPAVYSLFQGDQWTTRLEIGFEALFAAVAAGLLVLLIALTLIILKLGFLLLLVAGPFFLIIGIHPGFGRVIAIRWFEMLVGVLLKQVAVALTLSVLLYCYSLIMGTTDQVLPWALKIMMIALVTVAVFIYRKPFQHLFSSVGYGMLGADERAQVSLRESAFGFRRVTAGAAGVVVPGMGASRASRWARRGTRGGRGGRRHGGGQRRGRRGRGHGPRGDGHRARRGQPRQRQAVAGRGGRAPAGRRRRCRCLTAGRPRPAPPRRAGPAAAPPGRAPGRAGRRSRRSARAGPTRRPRSARARRPRGVPRHHRKRVAGWCNPPPFRRIFQRGGRGSGTAPRGTVLGALAPAVQVARAGHGTDHRAAAAAVRRRRPRARRARLLPGEQRGSSGGSPAAAASAPRQQRLPAGRERLDGGRRPAVDRPRGHARLHRGRRRDLPVAAVHARRT